MGAIRGPEEDPHAGALKDELVVSIYGGPHIDP